MTSLLICYPDIPYNAVTITPSATTDTAQNEFNLTAGPRSNGFALASAGTTLTLDFDLGAGFATEQNTVNYVILARADKLQAGAMSQLLIRSSSNGSVWTTRITQSSFSSATLYGPRSDDYIQLITATSAFRYWRADYTTTSSKLPHSKLYFGTYFDWGREPSTYKISREASGDLLRMSSGAQYGERIEEPRYFFEFTWYGITDAKIQSFQTAMAKSYYRANGVFLYTDSLHHVLDNQRLVHCRMLEPRARKIHNNYYEVTIAFEEMIG
jgi:hypothetical protein